MLPGHACWFHACQPACAGSTHGGCDSNLSDIVSSFTSCRIVQSAAPSAAGVIEAWEFLGSFGEVLALGRVPALAALEASLADPAAGGGAAEKAMMALVVLVAEETFGAAAAVAAEADPDVRQRDLESAFPVIRVRLGAAASTPLQPIDNICLARRPCRCISGHHMVCKPASHPCASGRVIALEATLLLYGRKRAVND